MRALFMSLLFGLIASSCSTSNDLMTRYHEDGRAKPVVAIASMIDATSFDCPWSLSEEFTSMIVQQMGRGGKIFVRSTPELPFVENPFGLDLSWVQREFQDEEFVVFFELIEHVNAPAIKNNAIPPNLSPQEVSTNLEMAVRIRVVDVRGDVAKIVLQEVIKESYYIPKTLIPTDYNQIVWGVPEYRRTPMGIAHMQLAQEIATRVNDYILLAKSR
jgi:hypothetical protein